MTAKLLATLGDVAGLVLLDLGSPGLFLSLKLQPAHMLVSLPDTLPGCDQGPVGLALSQLGAHDSLASLHNAGVEVTAGAIAKRTVQDAAVVAGIGRSAEDAATAAVGGGTGRRGGMAGAARGRR